MRLCVLAMLFAMGCSVDADGDGFTADEDCNDESADVFPGAPDFRGDGCDADCAEESDADGDDWPDDADCDEENPSVYPCSPDEVDGDGVDSDCDGSDAVRTDGCVGADPTAPEDTPMLTATCDPA
ncbi:MAG: hypothetical protein KC912_25470 [Proteobacteria bacterium]|nr:hypothetical protein [Pseudomonadota bacterium]